MPLPIIIGSRSPRRLELLQSIVAPERLIVLPPANSDEPGFDDLLTITEFESRILEIVACKRDDVTNQIRAGSLHAASQEGCILICADTTVIVENDSAQPRSLGQPPESKDWPNVVKDWFRRYLAGKTHVVLSGVSASLIDSKGSVLRTVTRTCATRVTMRKDVEDLLDWYVSTGEPVGKAGGYAIQGAGSVFVTGFEGSFSNVVGLPLEDTLEMLREFDAFA